jgi:hypothetical protein
MPSYYDSQDLSSSEMTEFSQDLIENAADGNAKIVASGVGNVAKGALAVGVGYAALEVGGAVAAAAVGTVGAVPLLALGFGYLAYKAFKEPARLALRQAFYNATGVPKPEDE